MISKATCVGNILSIIYHLLSHLPAGKHTQTDILISYIYIYIQTDILIYMCIQYDSAEWKPAFLRQAREFIFFPLLPREASKGQN